MSLERIRQYLLEKSPEHLLKILDRQEDSLDMEIKKLQQIKGMVQARRQQTKQGMNTNVGTISIQEFPSENLFLGPKLPEDYDLADGWIYLPTFYAACAENDIPVGFSVGTLVEHHNLRRGLWNKPSRYFTACLPNNILSFILLRLVATLLEPHLQTMGIPIFYMRKCFHILPPTNFGYVEMLMKNF